jgi:hypothetical protein
MGSIRVDSSTFSRIQDFVRDKNFSRTDLKLLTEEMGRNGVDAKTKDAILSNLANEVSFTVTDGSNSLTMEPNSVSFPVPRHTDDVQTAKADAVISEQTSWGNLSESGLGSKLAEQLKNRVSSVSLVSKVLDRLSPENQREVSVEILKCLSSEDLDRLGATPQGKTLLSRMSGDIRKDVDLLTKALPEQADNIRTNNAEILSAAQRADTAATQDDFARSIEIYAEKIQDGSLSTQDLAALNTQIAKIKDPIKKAWAVNTLELIKKNSTTENGNLVPNNQSVKDLMNPARIRLLEQRTSDAAGHPVLSTIKDPATREQMKEFLMTYMTDPVFMAVSDNRSIDRGGAMTNLFQTFSSHKLGSGSIDSDFGACIECQSRVQSVFNQFKAEWSARPENAGKPFKLEVGSMQTQAMTGFQHNFVFVKTDASETFYIDPWGSQRTDSASITTKEDYLRDYARGVGGTHTFVKEGNNEVFNPADHVINARNW